MLRAAAKEDKMVADLARPYALAYPDALSRQELVDLNSSVIRHAVPGPPPALNRLACADRRAVRGARCAAGLDRTRASR